MQKGGKGKNSKSSKGNDSTSGKAKTFDKEYWKDKECFKCHKPGHPATHCPEGDDDDNAKSRSSQAKSVKKLEKEVKSMKKAFTQLKETKEESDLSASDESEGESHFQFHDHDEFQFAQVETEFEPQIANLFKQRHGPKLKLNLRQVILLDSQSTIDLLCNKALVTNVSKSFKSMQLKSSGSTMIVRDERIP